MINSLLSIDIKLYYEIVIIFFFFLSIYWQCYRKCKQDRWNYIFVKNVLTKEIKRRTYLEELLKESTKSYQESSLSIVRTEGCYKDHVTESMKKLDYKIEEKSRKRYLQQEAIASLGQKGIISTDLDSLMVDMVKIVAEVLCIEFSGVLEILPNQSVFFLRAGIGWKAGMVSSAVISNHRKNAAGYTMSTGKSLIFEDLMVETRFSACPFLHNHRINSGILVLIQDQEQPYGVLGAYSKEHQKFTTDDINFLQSVSHILTAAIQKHKQQEKLYLLERAINASSNGIVITEAVEPNNEIIYVNKGFEKITGYERQEVIYQNCRFLQLGDRNQPIIAELRKAIFEGREYNGIIRNYRKDGSLFWNELHISPVYNNQGHLTHFIGVQTDITQRKKAEEAIRESEQYFRGIFEQAAAGIAQIGLDGKFISVNQRACQIWGYTEVQLLNSTLVGITHPEDINTVQGLLQALYSRSVRRLTQEYRYFKANGKTGWGQLSVSVVLDANASVKYYIVVIIDISDRKQLEIELKQSRERLDSILSSLEDAIWSLSTDGETLLYINPSAEKIYGYSIAEFYNNPQLRTQIIHPEDFSRVEKANLQLLNGVSEDIEYRILHASGQVRWIRSRAQLIYNGQNQAIRIDRITTDITEQVQTKYTLRQERDLLNAIASTSVAGIVVLDLTGKVIFANARAEQLLELKKSEFRSHEISDRRILQEPFLQVLQNKETVFNYEYLFGEQESESKYLSINASPIRDVIGQINGVVFSVSDITQRKLLENHLLYDALHDALTGLSNRLFFIQRLEQAIKQRQKYNNYLFAVLFLDLDHFKMINDSLGHLVGDKLLIAIARRLENCVPDKATIARLGGDEFIILLENIYQEIDAIQIAQEVQDYLSRSFDIDGYEVFTSISIGIALSTGNYSRPEDILRDADIAMYKAKAAGRCRYQVFNRLMHAQILNRMQLETDLRKAIEKKELIVYYQPIVCLKNNQLKGFEALLRWHHPDRGLVSPVEFIPIAEETGFIVTLGEWVLRQACTQMKQWEQEFGHNSLKISVNLSGRQLKEVGLVDRIKQILQDTALPPQQLKLEITETMLMENIEQATEMLQQLQQMKVNICLDDFGTGYSSLSYLHRFPINTLKIDRSFVKFIDIQQEKLKIVQAIVSLAHTLNMNVIAEGIETHLQSTLLEQTGCEYGQGYLFAKPIPPEEVETLFRNNNKIPCKDSGI